MFIRQRLDGGDIDERLKIKDGKYGTGRDIDSSGRHWDGE